MTYPRLSESGMLTIHNLWLTFGPNDSEPYVLVFESGFWSLRRGRYGVNKPEYVLVDGVTLWEAAGPQEAYGKAEAALQAKYPR